MTEKDLSFGQDYPFHKILEIWVGKKTASLEEVKSQYRFKILVIYLMKWVYSNHDRILGHKELIKFLSPAIYQSSRAILGKSQDYLRFSRELENYLESEEQIRFNRQLVKEKAILTDFDELIENIGLKTISAITEINVSVVSRKVRFDDSEIPSDLVSNLSLLTNVVETYVWLVSSRFVTQILKSHGYKGIDLMIPFYVSNFHQILTKESQDSGIPHPTQFLIKGHSRGMTLLNEAIEVPSYLDYQIGQDIYREMNPSKYDRRRELIVLEILVVNIVVSVLLLLLSYLNDWNNYLFYIVLVSLTNALSFKLIYEILKNRFEKIKRLSYRIWDLMTSKSL